MGVVGTVWRLGKTALACALTGYLCVTLAMLAWTFLWPDRAAATLPKVDVIVCLGAGMDRNGNLGLGAQGRVERCVDLYNAGLAPKVLFSGGTARPDGPSAGAQMGRYGETLGLPAAAIIVEGAAQSTLQNALFSLELIANADTMILVSEAFHLPRSWVAFKWAALETGVVDPQITLVMSEPVRPTPDGTSLSWRSLMRESVAIWFNIARMGAYSASLEKNIDWLQ